MASEAGLTVGSSISAANAVVPTLNPSVPPCPNPSGKGTETGTRGGLVGVQRSTPLTGASEEEIPPLPTPINVEILENFLLDHPIRDFVLRLCSKVHRYGADIGYTGPRVPRFSRHLPTALAQPGIVTQNLATEIALGRVAGPFSQPPFPNFQVSPIGLVPKKHSDKFRPVCNSRGIISGHLIWPVYRGSPENNTRC